MVENYSFNVVNIECGEISVRAIHRLLSLSLSLFRIPLLESR